jgi:hypothetical protein
LVRIFFTKFVEIIENMHPQALSYQFSNIQLELLKLYTRNISDEDLVAIKDLLAQFFAKKATHLANKAWDEKGLNADDILNTHIRTPYKKK